MLEIAVHGHEHVALSVFKAGGQSGLMSEVARKRNVRDVWIGAMESLEYRNRVIAARVVDEEQ